MCAYTFFFFFKFRSIWRYFKFLIREIIWSWSTFWKNNMQRNAIYYCREREKNNDFSVTRSRVIRWPSGKGEVRTNVKRREAPTETFLLLQCKFPSFFKKKTNKQNIYWLLIGADTRLLAWNCSKLCPLKFLKEKRRHNQRCIWSRKSIKFRTIFIWKK